MRTPNLQNTLATTAALAVLAYLPAPAWAQFTLTLSPSAVTGLPGSTDLVVYGSLANLANTPTNFVTDSFNLLSGPSTADLTMALVFSDDNLTNPQTPLTLGAKQVFPGPTGATFAPLLFLNADPAAPLGLYKGNFRSSRSASDTLGTSCSPPDAARPHPSADETVPTCGIIRACSFEYDGTDISQGRPLGGQGYSHSHPDGCCRAKA